MTFTENEIITERMIGLYEEGAELVVELTDAPVVYTGWSTADEYPFTDPATGHTHRACEVTVRGMKRGELL